MGRYRTFWLPAALAASLAVTTLGIVPGAAGAASHRTPAVGQRLAVLKVAGYTHPVDHFGSAVAISGNTAVVADSPGNASAIRVWVFTKTAARWKQAAEMKAPASGDGFGFSLAVSGTTVVVGAPAAASLNGAAYVFAKTATGWKQTAELKEPGGVPFAADQFGYSVAISGSTIAVGAPNHAHGLNFGETYVFTKTSGGWRQGAKLAGPGNEANSDGFGYSVAVSRTAIVVGAPYAATFAGRAFVFTKTASGWKQAAKIKGSGTVGGDSQSGSRFGSSVSISGTIIVVGAPHAAYPSGRVYVFTRKTSGWKQSAKLKDGVPDGFFGTQVAAAGKALLATYIGHADVFTKTAAGWKRTALKTGGFEVSAGLSGSLALVAISAHPTGTKGKTAPARVDVFEG